MTNKDKFSPPPTLPNANDKNKLTPEEKERRARMILENAGKPIEELTENEGRPLKKVQMVCRVPEPYYKDIQTIMDLTGLTMNAVILQILLPGIKEKLKIEKKRMGVGDEP